MGERITKVHDWLDAVPADPALTQDRRIKYTHLLAVSQFASLLALRRDVDVELACIAGLLHDIHSFLTGEAEGHAARGAEEASGILMALGCFDQLEIDRVCQAIARHSSKGAVDEPLDEVLKDADVLQHHMYNPLWPIDPREQSRYDAILRELGSR